MGVTQNHSFIIRGITTFKSLKNGVNNEKITPKENANRVCRNIIGIIHKKIRVTFWEVMSKKHTAKAIDIRNITNSTANMLS